MDTSKLAHKKFTLPKGYNFKELIMRETCGLDEQIAARVADSRGEASNVAVEMVRRSIVAVDGAPVVQPFLQFDNWNTRTRQFVLKAYEQMNSVPEEDIAVFQGASVELSPSDLAALSGDQKAA